MMISAEIERILPRLRRFARASCGVRELADSCVEHALKNLIEERSSCIEQSKTEFQFQLFRMVELELEARAGNDFEKRCWRALILVDIEGFSAQETAQVLGVDVSSVKEMVASGEAIASTIVNFDSQPRDHDS